MGIIGIDAKIYAKNDFHTSASNDLDLWSSDLELALPVTPYVRNLSSDFERCIVFRSRYNGWHETDGQTDWRTRTAAS